MALSTHDVAAQTCCRLFRVLNYQYKDVKSNFGSKGEPHLFVPYLSCANATMSPQFLLTYAGAPWREIYDLGAREYVYVVNQLRQPRGAKLHIESVGRFAQGFANRARTSTDCP
jgi:hypothetical protein